MIKPVYAFDRTFQNRVHAAPHVSICIDINALQDFQERALSAAKESTSKFVARRTAEMRVDIIAEGGFHLAAFDEIEGIVGTLSCCLVTDEETYKKRIALMQTAGMPSYAGEPMLVLTTGIIERRFSRRGVMSAMLKAAQSFAQARGIDTLTFVAALENLPMLKIAFEMGYKAIGFGRHTSLENPMLLFKKDAEIIAWPFSNMIYRHPIQPDAVDEIVFENMLDDDYQVTGIDLSGRSLILQKPLPLQRQQIA